MNKKKLIKQLLFPRDSQKNNYYNSCYIPLHFLDIEMLYTVSSDRKAYCISYRRETHNINKYSKFYSVIYIGFNGKHLLLLDLNSNTIKYFHPNLIDKVYYQGTSISLQIFYAKNGMKLKYIFKYIKYVPINEIFNHFFDRVKLNIKTKFNHLL